VRTELVLALRGPELVLRGRVVDGKGAGVAGASVAGGLEPRYRARPAPEAC
jgi:hypothetical protein